MGTDLKMPIFFENTAFSDHVCQPAVPVPGGSKSAGSACPRWPVAPGGSNNQANSITTLLSPAPS